MVFEAVVAVVTGHEYCDLIVICSYLKFQSYHDLPSNVGLKNLLNDDDDDLKKKLD